MQFKKKYEPIVRMVDDTVVDLGLFDTYEKANDAAIQLAICNLPTENVKAYQINRVYINLAVWKDSAPPNGGI